MSGYPLIIPKPQFFDLNGNPLNGGKLESYLDGGVTPAPLYSDGAATIEAGTTITLNSRGEPNTPLFAKHGVAYTLVLKDALGATVYSVSGYQLTQALTQSIIGALLFPRTSAEIVAGVTPVNFAYLPGNVLRYANNTTPGTTDMTTAIQAALDQHAQGGPKAYAPAGTYLTGTINWPANNLTLCGEASSYTYNTSATPRTIFKAKTATIIVFDLVQTGTAEDRTGNHLCDFRVDGNSIAQIGITCVGANVLERVSAIGCTVAGCLLDNFTNATRLVRCGFNSNSGWGLKVQGASTTIFSAEECLFNLNTLGGVDLEAGVVVNFKSCICESNAGPGLRIFRPNTHTNAFLGLEFDTCWFEDNGSTAPNFTIVTDAQTRNEANAPSRIVFRNCRINPSTATRKHMDVSCAKWLTFENCQFDASTASDALTLAATSFYVAWIDSANAPGFTGLSATQIDNAIAQGTFCYSSDRGIVRTVGAGAPAAAFTNSWVNFGAPYGSAAYWFDAQGNVKLKGAIKSGTVTNSAFTLPAGYRPANTIDFVVDSNNAHGMVRVASSGAVTPQVGSNIIFNLDGIDFSTR